MRKNFEIFENDENLNSDDFYLRFKEKLEETHSFPSEYVFKYIIPSEQGIIGQLYSIFEDSNASFSTRDSKTGKYTGITIKVPVDNADDVVVYYKQAANIEGIMAL